MKFLMQFLMASGLSALSTMICKYAFSMSTTCGILAVIFSVFVNIATAYYVINKE